MNIVMNKDILLLKTLLASIACCLLPLQLVAQTGMKVICQDGSEQLFSITETGKIYFDAAHLLIDENEENASISIPFAVIRKIVFTSLATAVPANTRAEQHFFVYPNPTKDYLSIAGDDGKKRKIKISALDGQLLMSDELLPDEKINVSRLPSGFYLIQINGETLKFSKL
jgi:hypothetical protein